MNMNKNSRLMYTQDFIFDILSTMYFYACAYQVFLSMSIQVTKYIIFD